MAGLFDTTNDPMAQVLAQRQKANQALGSPYGKYGGIVQAGGMFADTMADAIAGGGYGSSDPTVQKATELKKIVAVVSQQFPGQTNTPDFYKAVALAVQDKYPEKAQEAMDKARQIEQEQQKGKLTGLQIESEQAKLDADKAAKDAEVKGLKTRQSAVTSLFPNSSQEVRNSIAADKDLFKTAVTENLKVKGKNTKIIEASGKMLLVDTDTGETIKELGDAPDKGDKLDTSNMGAAMRAASNRLFGVDFKDLTDPEKRKQASEEAMKFLDKNKDGKEVKPPAQVLLRYAEANKNVRMADSSLQLAKEYIGLIENDVAKYGNIENLKSQWRAFFGESTESDRAKANIRRFTTGAVNAILNMAKGPQTEGDAQRAKEQILSGLDSNDPKLVQDGLELLQRTLEDSRAADIDSMTLYSDQYPSIKNTYSTKATNEEAPQQQKTEPGAKTTSKGTKYTVIKD